MDIALHAAGQTRFSGGLSSSQCKEKLGKPLPQQYALELLTVYAWERGCKETYFKTAQGFQTVLKLVQNYKKLCIYWEKYYDFDNPVIAQYLRKQLRKPRPVILDPADPTGNLGGGDSQSWPRLAREAEAWLSYPCFKNADGSPVGSWYIEVSPSACSLSSSPPPPLHTAKEIASCWKSLVFA